MPREAQHMVNLSTEEFKRLQTLRTALAEKSGRKVSLAATIGRALESLEAAHQNGAWLNPAEAWRMMRERTENEMASVLAQMVRAISPDIEPLSIKFDERAGIVEFSYRTTEDSTPKKASAITLSKPNLN